MAKQKLLGRIMVHFPEPDRRVITTARDGAPIGAPGNCGHRADMLVKSLETESGGDVPDSHSSVKAAAGKQPPVGGKSEFGYSVGVSCQGLYTGAAPYIPHPDHPIKSTACHVPVVRAPGHA